MMTGPWTWWTSSLRQQEEEPDRRFFLRRWFTDESFYRDIFTNTVAAGVVAIIVYLYAIGAGYVRSPTGWQTLMGIWNVVWHVGALILIWIAFWWAWFFNPKSERHQRRSRWKKAFVWAVFVIIAVFFGLTQWDTMVRPLPFWPYNTEPFTIHFKDGRTF